MRRLPPAAAAHAADTKDVQETKPTKRATELDARTRPRSFRSGRRVDRATDPRLRASEEVRAWGGGWSALAGACWQTPEGTVGVSEACWARGPGPSIRGSDSGARVPQGRWREPAGNREAARSRAFPGHVHSWLAGSEPHLLFRGP